MLIAHAFVDGNACHCLSRSFSESRYEWLLPPMPQVDNNHCSRSGKTPLNAEIFLLFNKIKLIFVKIFNVSCLPGAVQSGIFPSGKLQIVTEATLILFWG